ncbi:MAG: DUF2286 domain-containing protein [Caldisphaeraceae archaeon]|nr:DUF2286 domain-containing protein [Caldisphaeraceae archaeon]MEB3692319.1 DUF2286 domain-containing protein [Caldisphaeraceae archaeon]MEB3798258.1 DUF2286 domain-containing protein [Caldisphaeraceae archaeon]
MKLIVIRSEKGNISYSDIVEGELSQTVKRISEEVIKEWDPELSDFIVLKDTREVDLPLPLKPELVDMLRRIGSLGRKSTKAVVKFPIYTISFENMMIDEDKYIENKIYLIAPYINDDIKAELESEAMEITSQKSPPSGIEAE